MQRKILIVDDSTTERAIVERNLVSAGYDVLTAENGRDGLRRLYEGDPDLVILDVVMPELDGWGTLERIRDVSDIPVIMLTGQSEDEERIRGLRSGAVRVLQALVEHRNQVLSRSQLMELAWGEPFTVSDDQVKVAVASLRKKIERDPAEPALIQTVRGFGYRYYPPD